MDGRRFAPVGTRYACRQCGYDLSGSALGGACPECGRAVAASLPERTTRGTSGCAVWSLVLGILSITCFGALGIVAIILGVVGIEQANSGRAGGSSRGQSIAGIILGSIGVALALIWWFWMFVVAAS